MHAHRNADLPGASLPGIEHTTLAGHDLGARQLSLWRQTLAPGVATPLHGHDCEEVVVVEAGRGQVRIEGDTVEFGPDSTLVLPPHRAHQIVNTGDVPLRLLAAFASTPVATRLPDGTPLELPWRS